MATWGYIAISGSLQFNITLTQTTPSTSSDNFGASQVNWSIDVASTSGYSYNYGNKIYLQIGNEVVYNFDDSAISTYKRVAAGAHIANGTTTTYFSRQNDGYLNVTCTFAFRQYQKANSSSSGTYTFTGTYSAMYSKCTAPSSFSCTGLTNGDIVAPQTLTFSWSGAAGGTHNDITGYTIYYKIASSLTYPTISDNSGTITVSSTSTSGTKTWSLSGNRGSYIAFKILTKGTVTGYDSDLSSVSFYVKVNTVPTVPTVTYNSSAVTSIVLKSTQNSATFGISGSTDIDSQTITYHYGSSKTLINNNQLTISSITTNTSVSFYAKDGLEYSNAKTVTITKNTAPSISTVTLTGVSYSAGAGTTYILSVQPSIKVNKTGVGTVGIEAVIRTGSSSGTEIKTTQISSKAVAANTSIVSFETFNIQQIIGSSLGQDYNSSNTYWVNFKISYNDGVETSTITTVIDSQSREIKSAPAPSSGSTSDIHIYNQFSSTTDIAGTSSGQFYDKIRVISYKDDSLDPSGYTCVAKFGNVTYPVTFDTDTDGNYRYFDITFSTIPPANTEGTITITGTDGYVTKSYTTWTIKETKAPYVGGTFSSTITTIYMFNSQPSSYTNTLTWPFDQYTSYTSACAKEYNLSSTATTAIKLRLNYGNSKKDCTITSPTKSSNNLSSTITPNNLFASPFVTTSLNLTPYQGVKNLTIQYVITNLFGQEFVSASKTIQFNFNRSATLSATNIALKYASSSSGTKTAIGSKYLQEEAYLFFDINSLGLYTTEQFTINIYAQSADGTNSLPKTLRKTITYSQGQSGISYGTGYNTASTNNLQNIAYGQLPQLGASSYTFTIEIIGQYSGTISVTKTVNAIKRAPSNSILQSCSYSNGNWSYQAVLDNGLSGASVTGVSAVYKLYDSEGNLASNTNLSGSSGTIASSITVSGSIYLRIKTTVTLSTSTTNSVVMINKTYDYYSTLVIVYANTATIAYRVHSIGINTGTIENKGIVEIHGIDGRDQIVLKNQTSSVSNSAVLDLTTLNLNLVKTVVSTSSTASVAIDLMNLGKISPSATTATRYLFAGTCTTGAQSVYTNASCYMSNGHLYSNTKQVASINTAAQTATSSYYLKGSSTQNGVELQTHASCYMLGGYLYSGGTKVDMGELYKLNPTTDTGKRYLTAVSNTTGIQLVNTNANCYMSGGYLYSNGTKVDMAELYKLNPTTTTSSLYISGILNTTGKQVTYTNASCYMSNGHLYSNAQQVASITLAAQGSTTSYYIKGSSTGNGSELYSNVNCYMLNGFLYSNSYKTLTENEVFTVPVYLKQSSSSTKYFGGLLNFYKVSTSTRTVQLFYDSRLQSGTLPSGDLYVVDPNTSSDVVLPSGFRPSSDTNVISNLTLYRITGNKPEWTSSTKFTITVYSAGTIKFNVTATLQNDGWERQYIAAY